MTRALAAGFSGLQLLTAIQCGRLPAPPSLRTLGIELVSAEPGEVVLRLAPGEFLHDPLGVVNGGVLMAIMETATGAAVHSRLAAGRRYQSVRTSSRIVRPVTASTGPILCVGRADPPAHNRATATAWLQDEPLDVFASARSTGVVQPL